MYYAKSVAYEYSGAIKAINDIILHGRVFPLRLTNPLIGGRGLLKRERTLWHEMLCKKSKSVDSEPTRHPVWSG